MTEVKTTPVGVWHTKVHTRDNTMFHAVTLDDDSDLGVVALKEWRVFPHRRNRIINDWDADKRAAWLAELAAE